MKKTLALFLFSLLWCSYPCYVFGNGAGNSPLKIVVLEAIDHSIHRDYNYLSAIIVNKIKNEIHLTSELILIPTGQLQQFRSNISINSFQTFSPEILKYTGEP